VSGETEAQVSGWTVDTLHELVRNLNSAQDEHRRLMQDELDRRLSGLQIQVDGRMDGLRMSTQQSMSELRMSLNERYETQTKALDAAFKAAEKAVETALASAEKAVAKAEIASDKRFESVNEFRQQLSDQTASFPTRNEVNTRLDSIAADVHRNAEEIRALELRLSSRLDFMQGGQAGSATTRTETRLNNGQVIAAIGAVVGIAAIIVTIILATGH